MAAPTYVQASNGIIVQSGSGTTTIGAGTGVAAGDIVILQVLQVGLLGVGG